jgi:hypothetical protein
MKRSTEKKSTIRENLNEEPQKSWLYEGKCTMTYLSIEEKEGPTP